MNIKKSFKNLKEYVEKENYKGWDPYDGLNSKFLNTIPLVYRSKFIRLAWIQSFKRLPFNLRNILGVKKEYNPKGLGLFLSAYCNLYSVEPKEEYLLKIKFLIDEILSLQTKGWSGSCWGYNFDWQARAFFQPKYTPTVVASTFIGYALLDAYDILKDPKLLKTARSICDFILKDLNRTYDDKGDFAFSYSPLDTTQVFNASLLGSRMLARVYSYTNEKELIDEAKKSVQFCVDYQQNNGAWAYGTLPFHQWIDNFHTGYNLECISEYMKYSKDTTYEKNINIGLEYYLNTFFTEDGKSKYYNNALFPIDIHAPAQLIVTLYRLGILKENKELGDKVLNWTIQNMQDEKGYFYYQIKKRFNSKIPYIRWAQSWMFFSMSFYIKEFKNEK
ncbi:delta-aminolevulinic acid dehydratase [bacterium]|nr:delta-aminolevulinic acid dehydratase [bacterium]MBU1957250.1 delta-aminolevulinic acid dehydratase [bacterium]